MTTSSGRLYFFLQIYISSAPITEGGPIGGYLLPSAGEVFLVTRALGFFATAVRSREESEESMDSAETTLNLLDLTLIPMEEKSGPNSVPILEAEGRKNLENKRKIRKKLPAEREPRIRRISHVWPLFPIQRPQLPKKTRVSFNRDLFTFKDEASSNLLQNQGVSPEKSRGDEEPVTSQISDPRMNRTTKLQPCHLQEDRRNYYQISIEHEGTGPYLVEPRQTRLAEQGPAKGILLRMSNPGYSPTSMTKSRNKGKTVGEKYSASRKDSDPRIPDKWVPRVPTRGNPGLGPWTMLPSKKWKTFDKENLPYFRIWKSLT
ncbi:hypothetical protein HID58_034133 [Brassica napus]|uniref:Uncharacterized protein n=1 Tax=Brassica napus TaxID=3708 RepID=A0ABQ8C179_BRANA|nr:hypothetical protein HID58_034133 [Brassica napus]